MVLSLITQRLKVMVETADGSSIHQKRKAITTFLPYAVWRYQDGQHGLLGILFHLLKVPWKHRKIWGLGLILLNRPMLMWSHVEPLVATLLSEGSPVSLKHAIVLASPNLPWKQFTDRRHLIQLWAVAVLMVPYTNEIGQSVVDTLLQIAGDPSLQPHIPAGMWSWLTKCPSLPPVCLGCFHGSTARVVRVVRALRDIEILKSYLLLIWSEWDESWPNGLYEMRASVREDFSGTGMGYYRQDLLRRLDYVLGWLGLGPGHLHLAPDTRAI